MTITITVTGEAEQLLAALCETAGTSAEEIARDGVAAALNGFNYQRVDSRGTDDAECATGSRARSDPTWSPSEAEQDPRARTTGDRHLARDHKPGGASIARMRALRPDGI